jgi:ABC-type branched-subunit amino acid transport system ATPase component
MSLGSNDALLAIQDLSVSYAGKSLVLAHIGIDVGPGEIVALLGANGAGKTTLIRAISGLIRLHGGAILSGTVRFAGHDMVHLRADRIVRLGLGQVPEGRLIFKNLTVEENLDVGAAILPRARGRERIDAVYQLFPRLAERKRQPAGLMSGGEQQMLALGRALASAPRLILIDELSLGLAPLIVRSIYEQLENIRAAFGTSMLIVEQNARLALEICDRAYVLERGEIVVSGTAEEVSGSERMRESYLGTSVLEGSRGGGVQ